MSRIHGTSDTIENAWLCPYSVALRSRPLADTASREPCCSAVAEKKEGPGQLIIQRSVMRKRSATTKHHWGVRGLNTRQLFSHSGGCMSKTRFPAPSPPCGDALASCSVNIAVPWSTDAEPALWVSSHKGTDSHHKGPTFMTSSNPHHLLKVLLQTPSQWGLRLPHMEGGYTSTTPSHSD